MHAVTAGAAELAIIHDADGLPPPVPASLTQLHIHTDVGDLVMHRSHRLAAVRTISGRDLAGAANLAGTVSTRPEVQPPPDFTGVISRCPCPSWCTLAAERV